MQIDVLAIHIDGRRIVPRGVKCYGVSSGRASADTPVLAKRFRISIQIEFETACGQPCARGLERGTGDADRLVQGAADQAGHVNGCGHCCAGYVDRDRDRCCETASRAGQGCFGIPGAEDFSAPNFTVVRSLVGYPDHTN
ncbi:hypothetical protein SDC9_196991 [bioreactor metagenome]|uniref:Uncharacterized protein n=1 Tax=bioreactor metagenome TaxID=1076179 RepID=A0A645IDF9_9ZZZZ